MRRAKLNLAFGAEVTAFVAPPSGPVVVLSGGPTIDYTAFAARGSKLPALMARAFQIVQSQSANDSSRKKSNASINSGITSFLRWCDEIGLHPKAFTPKLLLDFQSHLKLTRKAWTVYGHYTIVARCCSVLMETGLIERFPIPKNISLESAKAGSSAGATIATATEGGSAGLSADDANEKALGILVDAAWSEAFELLDRLELGALWRSAAKAWRVNEAGQSPASLPPKYIAAGTALSRDDCLKLLVQNLELAFGGFSPQYPLSNAFLDFDDAELTALVSQLRSQAQELGHPILAKELHSYFHPNKDLAGCALLLLAAAQINPESAGALRLDCVQADANPKIARVTWFKWRAGGEQASMPFPKGSNPKSKTIPNLLERYKAVSADLRAQASEATRDVLLLWGVPEVGKKAAPCVSDGGFRAWHGVKGALAVRVAASGAEAAVKDVALRTLPQLTLGLARTTALNVAGKRLNRDMSALALMDGRKSEAPLSGHYLRNDATHEGWDGEIRQAQSAMLEWARQAPIVLPPDSQLVAESLDVDMGMAQDIVKDELNAGMGASLVDGRVVVIDTPINALRMIQWLEKLASAQARLLRDNPERWRSVYQPQHKLFTDALAMVSKKSKSEAMKMAKDIQLPFPEVI